MRHKLQADLFTLKNNLHFIWHRFISASKSIKMPLLWGAEYGLWDYDELSFFLKDNATLCIVME